MKKVEFSKYISVIVISILLYANSVLIQGDTLTLYLTLIMSVVAVTFVSFFLKLVTNSLSFRGNAFPFILWMCLFFAFMFVHYMFAPSYKPLNGDKLLSQVLSTFLIIYWTYSPSSEEVLNRFSLSCIVVVIPVVAGLVFYSGGIMGLLIYRFGDNPFGTALNSNSIAINLIFYLCPVLYVAYTSKQLRWIAIPLCFLLFAMIFLTGSKRGIISFAVLFICSNFIFHQANKGKAILIIFIALVLVYQLLFKNEYLYNLVGYRFEKMLAAFGLINNTNVEYDYSTEIRKEFVPVAFKMFFNHPILGNGHAYFETHSYFNTQAHVYHTHNNYLELLVCYGIIGFSLYYSFFIHAMVKLWKQRHTKVCAYFILCLSIVLLVIDTSTVTYPSYSLFYILLFMAYTSLSQHKYCSSIQPPMSTRCQ